MEFLKRLNPEFRRKLNIGLLALVGLQFFSILILSVFFSEPRRQVAPAVPLTAAAAPVPERSFEPAVAVSAPAASATPAGKVERVPQGRRLKSIKQKLKQGRIAKHQGLPRKLPPLKVAKQLHADRQGKRPMEAKVVAKAPNGSAAQAERW